jgi:hypothetical protein
LLDVVQVREKAEAMDMVAHIDDLLYKAGVTTPVDLELLRPQVELAELAKSDAAVVVSAPTAVAGATLFELLGMAAQAFATCPPKERAPLFADIIQIFVRLSEGRTVAVDIEAPGVSETGGWLRAQLEARIASSLRIPLREPGRKKWRLRGLT